MGLWESVHHCPKLSCALPSSEQCKGGGRGGGGGGAAGLTFYACCSCRTSPRCWRPFGRSPLSLDEALPQPSLRERERVKEGASKGTVWEREGRGRGTKDGWGNGNNEQRQQVKMKKKQTKLILLSRSCKEPPGVCVFAVQAAAAVRKPSVANFNWGITAYALREFSATYLTLWINKACNRQSAQRLFVWNIDIWSISPCIDISLRPSYPFPTLMHTFLFGLRALSSPCPSGIWGTSFPAGDRHITLFPLTWPSTWACGPNEQVIPAERSGT